MITLGLVEVPTARTMQDLRYLRMADMFLHIALIASWQSSCQGSIGPKASHDKWCALVRALRSTVSCLDPLDVSTCPATGTIEQLDHYISAFGDDPRRPSPYCQTVHRSSNPTIMPSALWNSPRCPIAQSNSETRFP